MSISAVSHTDRAIKQFARLIEQDFQRRHLGTTHIAREALEQVTASFATLSVTESKGNIPSDLEWVYTLSEMEPDQAALLIRELDPTKLTPNDVAEILSRLPQGMTELAAFNLPCRAVDITALPDTLTSIRMQGLTQDQVDQLAMRYPDLEELALCFGTANSLEAFDAHAHLQFLTCKSMRLLETLPQNLPNLESFYMNGCRIFNKEISLGHYPMLKVLDLAFLEKLPRLPKIPKKHPLQSYLITFCSGALPEIEGDHLFEFRVRGSTGLKQTLKIGSAPKLQTLDLSFARTIFKTEGLNTKNLPKLLLIKTEGAYIHKAEINTLPPYIFIH